MVTGAPLPCADAVVQPNILNGKDSGTRHFFGNNISTPPNAKTLPQVINDSSQQGLLVTPNLKLPFPSLIAPNLNLTSPLTDMHVII